jgi:hypothetical protein
MSAIGICVYSHKAAYDEFAVILKLFESLMKDGLTENQFGPRIMAIIVWSPQDLSSTWKSLNTGCEHYTEKHQEKCCHKANST